MMVLIFCILSVHLLVTINVNPNWTLLIRILLQSLFCLLPASCRVLAWLTFQPWRYRRRVPPKRWFTSEGLHRVMSQKTELFLNTTVRNSELSLIYFTIPSLIF
jgi:hypothetical protein